MPRAQPALEIQANPEAWKDFMTELGRKAIEQDGAEVLVFTGRPLWA